MQVRTCPGKKKRRDESGNAKATEEGVADEEGRKIERGGKVVIIRDFGRP